MYSNSPDIGFRVWTHFVAAIIGGFGGRFVAITLARDTGSVVPVWSSVFVSRRWRSFGARGYVWYRLRRFLSFIDVWDCMAASMIFAWRSIRVFTKSRIDRGGMAVASRSSCVSKDGSVEKALLKRSVFGETPRGCLTDVFKTRSVTQSNRDQYLEWFFSNRMLRMCLLISLLARSTNPFSSLE